MQNSKAKIYTVSEINSLIKGILEKNLPGRLTITGQITDWKLHHSGHCYFLLKDEDAQLPCVMWKSSFGKVKFKPENGLAVIAAGYIDVYQPQGKYQFYVESMTPAGVGALQPTSYAPIRPQAGLCCGAQGESSRSVKSL